MTTAQCLPRRCGLVIAQGLVALLLVRGASAQSPAPPVFKSSVDLVTVDVSIVDKNGVPVRTLTADQFEVSVDDRPRRVVSAELVEHASTSDAASVPQRPAHRAFTSNELHEIPRAPGRLVLIAVDQASFSIAGVRDAAVAARRLIDRLGPHDRVGLVAFPAPGPTVAPSVDHRPILDALDRLAGSADTLASAALGLSVSLTEALEIDSRNDATLNRVADRECRALNNRILPTCVESLRQEAQQVGMRAEQQSLRTLTGLRRLVERMSTIDERKTLLLISAGLPVGERGTSRLDTRAETLAIARDAAAANANIYVMHIDRSIVDAVSGSSRRSNDTLLRDSSLWAAGLDQLASASGGTVFRVSTGTEQVIDRVLQETSASYMLGVEAGPTDRNFTPHAIKVSVRMPGVQVRSRREFVLGAPPAAPDSPAGVLAAALRSARAERGLALAVSTHTLGAASAGGLRVLIAANVGRAITEALDAQVGYYITDTSGRVVGSALDTQRLTVASSSAAASASYVSLVGLAPGTYTLRLAAVDGEGRVGSVEHPFETKLDEGDGVRLGDLLLLDPGRSLDEMFAPFADGAMRGKEIDAYVELYPQGVRDGAINVAFSVADTVDGDPLVQTQASVTRADATGRSVGRARLDLSALPPGKYVAVATIMHGGRAIGRRHQGLRIEAARGGAAVERDSATSVMAPRVGFVVGDATGLVRSFAAGDVLRPDALQYFFARLSNADAVDHAGRDAATAALRTGRYDDAVAGLADAPADHLSVSFLRGLALLGRGDLEPAAAEFRDALRVADDFLPAAFYLGACYAAGGRDRDAAGAWQTALVDAADAPVIFDVLTDAWLRLGDSARAIDTLTEARDRWPDDPRWLPRLAAAQAVAKRRTDALATLAGHLDVTPGDAEAAALAIRIIYDAHASGRPVASMPHDKALALKYSAMYKAAGGANQPLVDRWVAFIRRS